MRRTALVFSCALAWSVPLVSADLHHLFVGSARTPTGIYGLEYDDVASSLTLLNTSDADAAHDYIAFNTQKASIYAVGKGSRTFYSYAVLDHASVQIENQLEALLDCANASASVVMANTQSGPHVAYGVASPGPASCGTVMYEDYAHGSLYQIAQNYSYAANSGISAVAMSPNARFLYSADYSGDAIWTHWVDEVTGMLSYLNKLNLPAGSAPSTLITHTMGQYMYTTLESSSQLGVLSIGWNTGFPASNTTYPLLPKDEEAGDYVASGLSMSSDGRILWATSSSIYNDQPSFVTAFLLDPTNGQVVATLGRASARDGDSNISPSALPGRNDLMALTYSKSGIVEIWQVNVTDSDPTDSNIDSVAELKVGQGCCGNAIWYD